MFHRTYTCKIVNKSSQNSLKTLSLKNELRDGTIVLSSTLSSFKSMMAGQQTTSDTSSRWYYLPIYRSDSSLLTWLLRKIRVHQYTSYMHAQR